MSRHFCFCIPVRFGVFILSFLSFLASGFLAAVAWILLHEMDAKEDGFTSVTTHEKIIMIVLGVIFTAIALSSLFGFLGSIAANRRFVKAYLFMSWVIFFASCASAGLLLYELWSGKELTSDCISFSDDGSVSTDDCDTHASTGVKAVATTIVVLELLIHLYLVTIIRHYVEQLEEGNAWSGEYKLTTTDVNQGLMNTTAPYPYADAHHSYGNA